MGDKALKIDFEKIGSVEDIDGVVNRIKALHRDAIDGARKGPRKFVGRPSLRLRSGQAWPPGEDGLEARPTVKGRTEAPRLPKSSRPDCGKVGGISCHLDRRIT